MEENKYNEFPKHLYVFSIANTGTSILDSYSHVAICISNPKYNKNTFEVMERIAVCYNSLSGILDPSSFVAEHKRMRELLKRLSIIDAKSDTALGAFRSMKEQASQLLQKAKG